MSNLSYLQNAAVEIEAASRDLAIDNALEAYAQALTLESTMKRMDDEQLKIILGGAYSHQARFWMEGRLMQNTMNARRAYEAAAGIEIEMPSVNQVNPYTETKIGDWVGD